MVAFVGRVIRYDDNKRQAIMKLTDDVNIGDTIDFWVKVGGRVSTNVSKIIYKNKEITSASAGMEVIIPVPNRVHPHDRIFKVLMLISCKKLAVIILVLHQYAK